MAAGDSPFSRPLADILRDQALLAALRARLADAKDLRELIADPPAIFMDERQMLLFYRGVCVALRPAYFNYLLLLAKRPKEIVTRKELYDRLWPGKMKTLIFTRPKVGYMLNVGKDNVLILP